MLKSSSHRGYLASLKCLKNLVVGKILLCEELSFKYADQMSDPLSTHQLGLQYRKDSLPRSEVFLIQ
ncbi:hypothetical protein Plhal304r1_c024g0081611 [Plasmopara halstedii]